MAWARWTPSFFEKCINILEKIEIPTPKPQKKQKIIIEIIIEKKSKNNHWNSRFYCKNTGFLTKKWTKTIIEKQGRIIEILGSIIEIRFRSKIVWKSIEHPFGNDFGSFLASWLLGFLASQACCLRTLLVSWLLGFLAWEPLGAAWEPLGAAQLGALQAAWQLLGAAWEKAFGWPLNGLWGIPKACNRHLKAN